MSEGEETLVKLWIYAECWKLIEERRIKKKECHQSPQYEEKLTMKRANPGIGIKDNSGNLVYERRKILGRWHQYAQELFKEPET